MCRTRPLISVPRGHGFLVRLHLPFSESKQTVFYVFKSNMHWMCMLTYVFAFVKLFFNYFVPEKIEHVLLLYVKLEQKNARKLLIYKAFLVFVLMFYFFSGVCSQNKKKCVEAKGHSKCKPKPKKHSKRRVYPQNH